MYKFTASFISLILAGNIYAGEYDSMIQQRVIPDIQKLVQQPEIIEAIKMQNAKCK